jgi:hypothetical protein
MLYLWSISDKVHLPSLQLHTPDTALGCLRLRAHEKTVEG